MPEIMVLARPSCAKHAAVRAHDALKYTGPRWAVQRRGQSKPTEGRIATQNEDQVFT